MIHTILLIEDEADLLFCLKEILEIKGYRVLTASDGEEGWDIYLKQSREISLIISDKSLPAVEGDEILRRVREIDPQQKFVLASGYIPCQDSINSYDQKTTLFVQKPYRFQEFLEAIARMLET